MESSTRRWTRRGAAIMSVVFAIGVIAAAPATAGFKSGTYSGKTSQDDGAGHPLHLQLKVNKRKTRVTVVFFELSAPPCAGKGGLQYAGLHARIKPTGRFKALSPGDGFYGYVKGKFKGRTASGTATYDVDSSGCHAGNVTWTARKR